MNILGYETSKVIDMIYNEIFDLNPSINIEWIEVDRIEGSSIATGSSFVDHQTGNAQICLTTEAKIDENAISHELLHILWFAKGSIETQSMFGKGTLPSRVVGFINNCIQHTFVYKRQLDMGILSDVQLRDTLASVYYHEKVESSNFFDNLSAIASCFGTDLISRKIFGQPLKEEQDKHTKIYSEAKLITDAIEQYDLDVPFTQRRAIVKTYRELEKIGLEYGPNNIVDWQNMCIVPPVFSQRQMTQKTNIILILKEFKTDRVGYLHFQLNMISDNQCCISLNVQTTHEDNFLQIYHTSTLGEFVSKLPIEYYLR